jgi:Thiol-activated cytolysin
VLDGLGGLTELPVRQRAPLTLTAKGLNFSDNTVTVSDPRATSVNEAIGTLLQKANNAKVIPASSTSFQMTDAYSSKQLALEVGASANYLSVSGSAKLNVVRNASQHTIAASYIQKAFTIAMDQPQNPTDVFSGAFTKAFLDLETSQGRISSTNPTAYVSSVTYGRIMLLTLTSTASSSEIKSALQVRGSFLIGGGAASLTTEQKNILQNGTLKISTLGGDEANARALISSGGDLSKFFDKSSAVTAFAPISYEIRSLKDNSIATVSETVSYPLKECALTKASIPVYLPDSLKVTVRIGADSLDGGSRIWGKFTYAGGESPEVEIANGLGAGEPVVANFTMPAGVRLGDLQSFVFREQSRDCTFCRTDEPDIAEITVQVQNQYITLSRLLSVGPFRIFDHDFSRSYALSNTR